MFQERGVEVEEVKKGGNIYRSNSKSKTNKNTNVSLYIKPLTSKRFSREGSRVISFKLWFPQMRMVIRVFMH